MRITAPIALAFVLVLSFPTACLGAVRYASPTGVGSIGCTAPDTSPGPCSLGPAVNQAAPNDEVIVEPGDYGSSGSPISVGLAPPSNVNVHGVDGQPAPRVFSNASPGVLTNPGTLRHLDIEYTGTYYAVWAGGTVDRLTVHAHSGSAACSPLPNVKISNTLCWTDGASTPAIEQHSSGGGGFLLKETFRNVTAWATGASADGLNGSMTNTANVEFDLTNSIVHGVAHDIVMNADNKVGSGANVVADHSNYANVLVGATNASVTPASANNNQAAAPGLVDPNTADLHEKLGSVTVDAGTDDPLNGATDLDGYPRTLGAHTDIGAFELTPPPAPANDTTIGAFELTPPPAPANDTTPPAASELAANPPRFAPTGSGGSVISRRKPKVARGTKVSFRLSEAASVAFTVEKQIKGRKRGKKCKAKRKKGKRCAIIKTVPGSFTVQGNQGLDTFKFSGRIRDKKLKRGSYRLVATPTDAARNRGAAVRAAFTIVR